MPRATAKDHAEFRKLWEAQFRGPRGEMEGRLMTIVDEVLYGEVQRADRQSYPIRGESPIWTQGRILINQIEPGEPGGGHRRPGLRGLRGRGGPGGGAAQ